MNLFNWVMTGVSNPATLCRWCRKSMSGASHAPVPLCDACFAHAYSHATPDTGNVWQRLAEEFPRELADWARKLGSRPTQLDHAEDQMAATQDAMALRAKARRLAASGQDAEAERLKALALAQEKAIAEFHARSSRTLADLEAAE